MDMKNEIHKFNSLNDRRDHFSSLYFEKQNTNVTINNPYIIDTLIDPEPVEPIIEDVKNHQPLPDDKWPKIPFFSNSVSNLNIFRKSKNVSVIQTKPMTLSSLLTDMSMKALHIHSYSSVSMDSVLLILNYPFSKDCDTNFFSFSSSVTKTASHFRVEITDPILYAITRKLSQHALTTGPYSTLFILGSDISYEDNFVQGSLIDEYFISMAKTIFATTIIGRDRDVLGLVTYPAYTFSFGTHSEHSIHETGLVRVIDNEYLLHIPPLWNAVFSHSFILQLEFKDVNFYYERDGMFSFFD